MKRILMSGFWIVATTVSFSQQPEPAKDSFYVLSPVEIRAIRAGENSPFTKTNISKKEISKNNLGQDIPFLLNQTPSVVVNADAGNGIGYTGIRIRGTDATRINVTLNGIPYNDAESQGTFFVNLPDFSSSVSSIQVQRGAGTSSNGAGAFGASINMSTNEVNKKAFAAINNTYGSFNTWKNTIKMGTGILNDRYIVEARLSNITSDGYIDRASSDLKAACFSAIRLLNKASLRLNIFTGKEKTYQAWNGVSENDIKAGNRTINYAGTEKPGDPYENETDNYSQTHYQLFFDQQFSPWVSFNTALFLTRGKGYYEQYKADRPYSDFGLPNPVVGSTVITASDFIRQLWLDNYYYGSIFSLQFKKNKSQLVAGGAYSRYDGDHYGKLPWASNGGLPEPGYKWYDHTAFKSDFNIYTKWQEKVAANWNIFSDLQYRHVRYSIDGFRDNPMLTIDQTYNFFNPKLGISFYKNGWNSYLSYGMAAKEPNRDDFEAGAAELPQPEKLHDIEAGLERKNSKAHWSVTLYYMKYDNQLVLTGKINDVGAYTRTNIPNSYRMGVELQGSAKFNTWLTATANLALSRNKVKNFTEYIDDYDNGGQRTKTYSSSDIAFSPAIVGGAAVSFFPVSNLELSFPGKYVSRQYLDNTQNKNRSLNPFYVQDVRAIYTLRKKDDKEVTIQVYLNNLMGRNYEPNGYTYSYFLNGATTTENFYFPMAGRNMMIAVNIQL